MPDLKLNKDTVLEALKQKLKDCHERLDREAEQLRKEITQVAEALPQMVTAAEKAHMAALIELQTHPGSYQQSGAQVQLHLDGISGTARLTESLQPNSKYRAFIFIHKVS